MNAARQPFSFSAAISVALAGLFAVRYALAPWPPEKIFTGGMPLASLLAGFQAGYPKIATALAAIIALWTLVIIIRLTVRGVSPTSRNYLPSQFFIVAAGGICFSGELLGSLLAAWLLALSTKYAIASFRKNYRFEDLFHAGLFLGAIPILYAPGVLFALLIPVIISVYRRSSRELAVLVTGALVPVPAAGFIYWVAGESPSFIYTEIWRCLSVVPGVESPSQFPVVATAVAGLTVGLAVAATVWFMTHRKGMRTRQRKVMSHISILLLLTLALPALPGGVSPSSLPLAAVPIALAVPYSFLGKLALPSSIVYFLILAAVLALNLAPILGVQLP